MIYILTKSEVASSIFHIGDVSDYTHSFIAIWESA